MGSTNKTDNLELSQFIDTDKPTWRGDYNGDMLKIDGMVNTVNSQITNVSAVANAALGVANNAQSTADDAVADVAAATTAAANANAAAANAQTTADTATTSVAAANGRIDDLDVELNTLDTNTTNALNVRYTKDEADARFQIKSIITTGNPVAVFVGNSNSLPGTWPEQFCLDQDFECYNHSIDGMGFTFGGSSSYQGQLENAADNSAFANSSVAYVFVCDGANDARSHNPTYNVAKSTLNYARSTFPNARVIVLPGLWSKASVDLDSENNAWLLRVVGELKLAAAETGCEYVDGSWSWHLDNASLIGSGVHYSASGYALIRRWLDAFLRGQDTWNDLGWTDVTIGSPYTLPSAGGVRACRIKGVAFLQGEFTPGASGLGNTDIPIVLPRGCRPARNTPVAFVQGGSTLFRQATINSAGNFTIYGSTSDTFNAGVNVSYPVF